MDIDSQPDQRSDGIRYSAAIAQFGDASRRLSDIVRPIGIGVVVFCWGLFNADKGLAHDVAAQHKYWIALTAAIATVGMLFDLAQAIVGYTVARGLLRNMEERNLAAGYYDSQSLALRSLNFFFVGKSILMPVAAGSVILLLFRMVL